MQKFPYDIYIKYLLVLYKFDFEKVIHVLSNAKHIHPDEEQLQKYKDDFFKKTKVSKDTKDLLLGKTSKIKKKVELHHVLIQHGILELWMNRYGFEKSRQCENCEVVFLEPDFFPYMHAFIFRQFTEVEIIEFFKNKFNLVLYKSDIALYKEKFFPLFTYNRSGWKKYINECRTKEKSYLTIALEKDPLYLRMETGAETKIQYSNILQQYMAWSYRKFEQNIRITPHQNDEGFWDFSSQSEARNWAKIGMMAGDRKQKLKPSDAANFLKEVQMAFQFEEYQIPNQDELDTEDTEDTEEEPGEKLY